MSEYWKSTPTYWCKFCSQYVRDTPLEKRSHEASAKHQNGIQRSLREIHKQHDRAERETARAKAEVERLNKLVGGASSGAGKDGGKAAGGYASSGNGSVGGEAKLTPQQRKEQVESLARMGVVLPAEAKREVTGVGGWEVVSERVIDDTAANRADTVGQEEEGGVAVWNRGVRKRKVEDEDEVGAPSRAWGSRVKMAPAEDEEGDLDALLSGVTAGKKVKVEQGEAVEREEEAGVKAEVGVAEGDADGDGDGAGRDEVKEEESATTALDAAPPVVFFKKRKAKR